jgi:hypothetical protein
MELVDPRQPGIASVISPHPHRHRGMGLCLYRLFVELANQA